MKDKISLNKLLWSVQILRDPLRGRGVTKKITKDHRGGRGGSPKDQRGSRSQEGGGGIKKIGQIGGAYKDNNYSQDQISVGDSGGDIFIDKH